MDFTLHMEGQKHCNVMQTMYRPVANESYKVMEPRAANTRSQPNMYPEAQNHTCGRSVSSNNNHMEGSVSRPVIPQSIYNDIMQQLNNPAIKESYLENPDKKINHNIRYIKPYLQFEEAIYQCKEDMLAQMKLSYEYSVFDPKQPNVYCIVCQEDIICIKKFYEHVRSEDHLQKLRLNVTAYTKQMIKILTKVAVSDTSSTTVSPTPTVGKAICYACKKEMDENLIDYHIKNNYHMNNYKQRYNIAMEKYEWMASRLNNCWYNIQRYSCVLCNERFDQKTRFLEHLLKRHANDNNGTYDFCTWCETMWLGNSNTFELHCTNLEHKYIVSNDEFEPKDVSDKFKQFILNHEKNAVMLYQSSDEVYNSTDMYEDLRTSLRTSLGPLFNLPIHNIHFYGSRFSGIGLPTSDIDIFVDFGSYHENNLDAEMSSILEAVVNQLETDKNKWDVLNVIREAKVPIISLFYRKMRLECDVSFRNGLAVENTKLIRCYTMQYPNCRKLILYIKKWWQLCAITGVEQISSYAFALCVIFYLQQRKLVCSVMDLIKQQNKTHTICGWNVCSDLENVNVVVNQSNIPFANLLLGFFDYFAEFDYRHNVICPYLGRLLKKDMFAYPVNLPVEIDALYMANISKKANREYFRIDSAFCVQDPYNLGYNITRAVQPTCVKQFKHFCNKSADILKKKKRY